MYPQWGENYTTMNVYITMLKHSSDEFVEKKDKGKKKKERKEGNNKKDL